MPDASLRDMLKKHGWPTLLFLQEVKIRPDDTATIGAVRKAVRRQPGEPTDAVDYVAEFCLPTDEHNARGFGRKVYGVCSIVRKDFYDRFVDTIRPVDWDKEGRFLITETKAQEGFPKLALINVYAVNGTENPYKDPETGLVIGTRHDRKLKVHALLQAECQRLEAGGFGCVVAGDLNVARSPADGFPRLRTFPMQHQNNRADFEARFLSSPKSDTTNIDELEPDKPPSPTATADAKDVGLGMIDTFRYLHPDKKGYTYYPRTKSFGESCDRVDMILVSRKLVGYVVEAGMHETQADRGPSDHVPLYARLSSADVK